MITILALALAASSPVCTKLSADFDEAEAGMATMHDFYMTEVIHYETMYARFGLGKDRDAAEAERRTVRDSDLKYEAKGNAITQLMIGHKCTPPDHIISAFTYSSKNPNRRLLPQSAAAQSK